MIKAYDSHAYAHNYIFGFIFRHNVYMVNTDASVLPYIMKLDKASRGQGMALRFKPDKEQKTLLLTMGAKLLCSEEYFNDVYATCKYNRGEVFEKMVTEYFGQEWKKDNIPYTKAGDVTVYGIAYQIKFEKATFTNEKSLLRA
jgi:hypothetical protein